MTAIRRISSPKPESSYHIEKRTTYNVCVLPTLNEDPVASEAYMTGRVRCRSEPVSPAHTFALDSWAPRRSASADTERKPAHRRHSCDVSSISDQQSKSIFSADADAFLIALHKFREQELDRPGMIHMKRDSAHRGDHIGFVPPGSQRHCPAHSPSKSSNKRLSCGTRFWYNVMRLNDKERQLELHNTMRPQVCNTSTLCTALENPRSPSSKKRVLRSKSDPGTHQNFVLDACAPRKTAPCAQDLGVESEKLDSHLENILYRTLMGQLSFLVVMWYFVFVLY